MKILYFASIVACLGYMNQCKANIDSYGFNEEGLPRRFSPPIKVSDFVEKVINPLNNKENIRSVRLGLAVNDQDIIEISSALKDNFHNLEVIDISSCNITNKGIKNLMVLTSLDSLKTIYVNPNLTVTDLLNLPYASKIKKKEDASISRFYQEKKDVLTPSGILLETK